MAKKQAPRHPTRGAEALLSRYAALDPARLPADAQLFVLETGTEQLVLLHFPESPLDQTPRYGPLTDAERAVLRRVLVGETNAAIARARKRSLRTVGHQVASIFRKLGVSSRRELLASFRVP